MPSWPDLVGKHVDEVKSTLLSENPDFQFQVLPVNSPTTRDFRENRVRLFVD